MNRLTPIIVALFALTACGNSEPEPGITDTFNQAWETQSPETLRTICIQLEADGDPLVVIGQLFADTDTIRFRGVEFGNTSANRVFLAEQIVDRAAEDC